jgi:hypothetical protein
MAGASGPLVPAANFSVQASLLTNSRGSALAGRAADQPPAFVQAARNFAFASATRRRSSGQWKDEDYDVLADGKVAQASHRTTARFGTNSGRGFFSKMRAEFRGQRHSAPFAKSPRSRSTAPANLKPFVPRF